MNTSTSSSTPSTTAAANNTMMPIAAAPSVEKQETTARVVRHPYRHNPYGDHSKVYYEEAQPMPVFQNYDNESQYQQYDNTNSHYGGTYMYNTSHAPNYYANHSSDYAPAAYTMNAIVPAEPRNYDPAAFESSLTSNSKQQPATLASSRNTTEMYIPIDQDVSATSSQMAEGATDYQNDSQYDNAPEPVYTMYPPTGTLHQQLTGRLSFCLYPATAFRNVEPRLPKHEMVRMFIGQLPYYVTEMQLGWLTYTFGGGANLFHFERITKTDRATGAKVPTGCFHCHMEAEQVPILLSFINDRLLVDDTGCWVADSQEDKAVLGQYCHSMKVNRMKRFQGRPYGTVVAQVATSTFDPDTHNQGQSHRGAGTGGFRRHC